MALLTANTVIDRVPQAATVDLSIVNEVIAEAQEAADAYCDRALESTAHDDYYDVTYGQRSICLRHFPVVGTIKLYSAANTQLPYLMTEGMEYVVEARNGIVSLLASVLVAGPRNARAVYTAGYTSATLPAGLRVGLYQIVAWLLESAGRAGETQEAQDGYSVTYGRVVNGLPEMIGAKLDPYCREALG